MPTNPSPSRSTTPECSPIRTRSSSRPAGHGCAARARWIATAVATAARGSLNIARNESPAVPSTKPSRAAISRSRIAWWPASTAGQSPASSRARRVEPSMSVNSSVTWPAGAALTLPTLTATTAPRLPFDDSVRL